MELEYYLNFYFRFNTFRGKQKILIEHLLENHNLIVSIPTGAGKSIIFQLAGLLKPGKTIVITPLVSLMLDQVVNLEKRNIKACAFYSEKDKSKKESDLENIDDYKFIYITPEGFSNYKFQEKLNNISLVVIDEAHTILWGKDFREKFLEIGENIKKLKDNPTVCAFSATLNLDSLLFIKKVLKLNKPYLYYEYPIKDNLEIVNVDLSNKKLKSVLKRYLDKKVIIYTVTILNAKKVYEFLLENAFKVSLYHGKMIGKEKEHEQKSFKENITNIMVATNSYGMGIDESHIRLIILYDIPLTLNDLLQQIGRAGRDNEKSLIIINLSKEKINEGYNFIINTNTNIKDKIKEYDKVIEYIYSKDKTKTIKKYYKIN